MNTKYNYSLVKHNTFGIDVAADIFFEYSSVEELTDFIADRCCILAREAICCF